MKHALTNGRATVSFSDGSNHPCAEDHDGPVMLVKSAEGERLMHIEDAREHYGALIKQGFRKVA